MVCSFKNTLSCSLYGDVEKFPNGVGSFQNKFIYKTCISIFCEKKSFSLRRFVAIFSLVNPVFSSLILFRLPAVFFFIIFYPLSPYHKIRKHIICTVSYSGSLFLVLGEMHVVTD